MTKTIDFAPPKAAKSAQVELPSAVEELRGKVLAGKPVTGIELAGARAADELAGFEDESRVLASQRAARAKRDQRVLDLIAELGPLKGSAAEVLDAFEAFKAAAERLATLHARLGREEHRIVAEIRRHVLGGAALPDGVVARFPRVQSTGTIVVDDTAWQMRQPLTEPLIGLLNGATTAADLSGTQLDGLCQNHPELALKRRLQRLAGVDVDPDPVAEQRARRERERTERAESNRRGQAVWAAKRHEEALAERARREGLNQF